MKQFSTSAMSDIAFLLLLFFIILAVVSVQTSPPITPATAEGVTDFLKTSSIISIDKEGNFYLDNQEVRLDSIPHQKQYALLAHRDSPYSMISPLIDYLSKEGSVVLVCLVEAKR